MHFLQETNGIDLLINNAGVGDGGAFTQYGLDNWEWLININLMGVVYGNHFFVPAMRRQKSGQIINIASIAGIVNGPSMSAYNASKAAVISLSETLFYELHPHNIVVSAVMPSFFKTNVMQHARGSNDALAMAQKLIDNSNLDAEPVAKEILAKAGQKKLHIILPKQARTRALIKRFLPGYFRISRCSRSFTKCGIG
jgi:short-subunit dehydrogenase